LSEISKEIIIYLFAAHIIGDFVFQSKADVQNKSKPAVLAKHSLIITLLSFVIVGVWNLWYLSLFIGTSHIIIDYIKAKYGQDKIFPFLLDQFAHLIFILIAAFYVSTIDNIQFFWSELAGGIYLSAIVVISGLVLLIRTGGIFIGIIVTPFLQQINSEEVRPARGLSSGGEWIGSLERILIFIMLLMEIPAAVGFLIAAKSILRFGEIKESQNRMEAEYIIIGTFLSFIWGLIISYGVLQLLQNI